MISSNVSMRPLIISYRLSSQWCTLEIDITNALEFLIKVFIYFGSCIILKLRYVIQKLTRDVLGFLACGFSIFDIIDPIEGVVDLLTGLKVIDTFIDRNYSINVR